MSYRFLGSAIFSGLTTALATAGEVTTDGSMGAATTLTGPNYTIGQDLGTTAGNNLFHSFGTFNLSQGDIATFTGANTIQNVISQVTDGNPSSIDGTIHSQVGTANFFFINPAGIVFGQHAAIDVPAAFHASTANELRFADGSSYNLHTSKGNLTAAAPESFGFLGRTGDIVIEGGQLKFKDGANVSFTGNSVTSNNATIEVPRGSLRVYGNGDAVNNVPINGELPAGNGAITMNGGKWDVSGDGGGDIWISGGSININNSARIYNDNYGNLNPNGGIHIQGNMLLINGGYIGSSTYNVGNAGDVTVNISGEMKIVNGNIFSYANSGLGNSGNITITTESLILGEWGEMSWINTSSWWGTAGNAGNIVINVSGDMRVLNGGQISSDTFHSSNNAGTITINAGSLTMDGQGANANELIDTPLISTDASLGSGGNAGNISINVFGEMRIVNGGQISSSTDAPGNAGTVTITANRLIIDAQGYAFHLTGITSQATSNSSGNAGNVIVNIKDNMLIVDGFVSSANYGTRDAGTVNISVGRFIQLTDTSEISTTSKTGTGGDITITAPAIVLNNSQITTSVEGKGKDGGDITLNGGYLVLDIGFIQANTVGDDAKGGDIFINMDGVLPNGGVTIVGGEHRDFIPHSGQNVIQAAANATENDGTITITNPSDSSAAGFTGAANRLEPIQIAKNPCIGIKKRASLRRKGRGALLKSSLKSDLLKTNDYAPNSKDVTHTNRKQRQQEVCAEG